MYCAGLPVVVRKKKMDAYTKAVATLAVAKRGEKTQNPFEIQTRRNESLSQLHLEIASDLWLFLTIIQIDIQFSIDNLIMQYANEFCN